VTKLKSHEGKNTMKTHHNLSIMAPIIYNTLITSVRTGAFIIALGLVCIGSAMGQSSGLFDSDEILELTLSSNMRDVKRDRGDDPQYFKATLSHDTDQGRVDIPLKIKTRGNSRKSLSNCKYPPILLNFAKSKTPNTSMFYGQDKMKLVTPCQGDQYVVNEYLVYKLYNIITPNSFRARLVKVIYDDTVKGKASEPLYGMILEEAKQMAKRRSTKLVKVKNLSPKSLEREGFLKLAVFQYFIANTDWSIQYQQNIKLLSTGQGSVPIPVPYDFDLAGIVNAPYAKPAPELELATTQERRYRGYCINKMEVFADVFETFNQLKDDFYAVYQNNPNLNERYIKRTLGYLDDFYKTINDPKKAAKAFLYPCDPNGTGNVIIKGLDPD